MFEDLEPHEEHSFEPVEGLPAKLPVGEEIVWQGRSNPFFLAVDAFHLRSVALYFGLLLLVRVGFDVGSGESIAGSFSAGLTTFGKGLLCLAILGGMAALMARKSMFTITTERVVLRHGVGIRKYINIPFKDIHAVELKSFTSGTGNIALAVTETTRIPYLHLWPFARPFRFGKPVPLLRGVDNATEVAQTLGQTMNRWDPQKITLSSSATVGSQTPTAPNAPLLGTPLGREVSSS